MLFESQLQMAADLGGIAGGPGAFHQGPSGMGVTGCGHRPLLAPLAGAICLQDQSQEFHQFSRVTDTGEIANFCHHGDGYGDGTLCRA
jgi:hypothetical protein